MQMNHILMAFSLTKAKTGIVHGTFSLLFSSRENSFTQHSQYFVTIIGIDMLMNSWRRSDEKLAIVHPIFLRRLFLCSPMSRETELNQKMSRMIGSEPVDTSKAKHLRTEKFFTSECCRPAG
ncbi:hypothetical protein FRC03_008213 [Tulasnella sp. 419]|nr:hypothetical protein FRC03_008213 [Tulasnella sp. 419]